MSSVTEVLMGKSPGTEVPATTTLALIEQGLKVFSGIYKRIYRSFTEELKLIYRLNATFLNEKHYVDVLDEDVNKADFDTKSCDIVPSADPLFTLEAQRVGKAEALMKISGRKGLDEDRITAQYLKAIKAPPDMLLPPNARPPERPGRKDCEAP